jgi:membrane protease YdiL (CAAX protease family)
MSDAAAATPTATPNVAKTVVIATLMGVVIAAIGIVPWVVSIRMNMRIEPGTPWAAATTICWLVIMLLWLGGAGWPRAASAFRRSHLRLWRPEPGAWSGANLLTIFGLICAMVALNVLWVLMSSGQPPADLSAYPAPPIPLSILIMGPLVSGVVEEVAFRGYMQSHLERIGPTFAILVTSTAFTLLHATHGLSYLFVVAPGFFLASVVYGYLALKSGSILPGLVLHFLGDFSYSYFVLLGGDPSRLFAN